MLDTHTALVIISSHWKNVDEEHCQLLTYNLVDRNEKTYLDTMSLPVLKQQQLQVVWGNCICTVNHS